MSNLVAFKGGAPKVKPLINKYGIGALSTRGVVNTSKNLGVLENKFRRMCLSEPEENLKKLMQFDPKTAYDNFPMNGDDTRFDKTDIGMEEIPLSLLASGALIAKDFYNDKESGDKLMEIVNYCYQEGIIRVVVDELPTELVGYVINLYEGSKYRNTYSEVMHQYAGVNKEFPSAWNFEGEPQEFREQRLELDPDWV